MRIYRFLLFTAPCFSWASQVSYHLFEEVASAPVACANVKNRDQLERKMADYNKKFLQTPGTQLTWMAEQLTNDYKEIFFNTDVSSLEVPTEGCGLSDLSVFESRAHEIIKKRGGLPSAALSVEAMYEIRGCYQDALLWAYVACKLGFEQGKSSASRLFLLMR